MKLKLYWVLIIFIVSFALGLFQACGDASTEGDKDAQGDNNFDDDDGPQTCSTDDECKEGEKCYGGLCVTVECQNNAECDEGYVCSGFQCVQKTAGKACTAHKECSGERERCIEERCMEADCLSNEECQKGFSCDPVKFNCVHGVPEGSPCESDAGCMDNQTCYQNVCKNTCQSNADCKEGEICSQASFGKLICMADVECRVDSDCRDASKPLCQNNKCVPDNRCRSDSDCPDSKKSKCDLFSGECVQCLSTPDCKSTVLICDTYTNTCIDPGKGCKTSADCTQDPTRPVCDIKTGLCVPETISVCKTNADCKDPTRPKCDINSGICVPLEAECTKNSDCKDPAKPFCNVGQGVCVANTDNCRNDGECTMDPMKKVCYTATGQCVQCLGDFDCEHGFRCDTALRKCVFNGKITNDCSSKTVCKKVGANYGCTTFEGNIPYGTQDCSATGSCPNGTLKMEETPPTGGKICYCVKTCVAPETLDCTSCGSGGIFPGGPTKDCPTGFECSSSMSGKCQRYCGSNADCVNPAAPSCIAGKCLCM